MQLDEQNWIDIYPDDKIIILDEDYDIHEIWNNRLCKYEQIQVKNFLSHRVAFTYLKSLYPEVRQQNVYLFCDYQPTPEGLNCLDLIQKFKINRSIFVTDNHGNPECMNDALKHYSLILPKSLVKTIRLNILK